MGKFFSGIYATYFTVLKSLCMIAGRGNKGGSATETIERQRSSLSLSLCITKKKYSDLFLFNSNTSPSLPSRRFDVRDAKIRMLRLFNWI